MGKIERRAMTDSGNQPTDEEILAAIECLNQADVPDDERELRGEMTEEELIELKKL